jgi:hypothetical protein
MHAARSVEGERQEHVIQAEQGHGTHHVDLNKNAEDNEPGIYIGNQTFHYNK